MAIDLQKIMHLEKNLNLINVSPSLPPLAKPLPTSTKPNPQPADLSLQNPLPPTNNQRQPTFTAIPGPLDRQVESATLFGHVRGTGTRTGKSEVVAEEQVSGYWGNEYVI